MTSANPIANKAINFASLDRNHSWLCLSLETPNDVQSVAQHSLNIQATSKGSDQTARMRRLIWGFAGRTYHIV